MNQARLPGITVCLCTFKRPVMLKRLLDKLAVLETDGAFTFSISVADNDAGRSAEPVVAAFASKSPLTVHYSCEPVQNIALARNRAIAKAEGDYIAFIDDDEFPDPGWLRGMLRACQSEGVSGVLGPVRPYFESPPPGWVVKGGFCERPECPTGTTLDWNECRTGNVLFKQSIISGLTGPFDPAFGTGGEDKEFFRIMMEHGHRFIWCNEAVVFEEVPPERLTRNYMWQRALLRGKNVLKHPSGRAKAIATSMVAFPVYAGLLPFTVLGGHHCFVKYSIKLCDHGGRILALFGLNPVADRTL